MLLEVERLLQSDVSFSFSTCHCACFHNISFISCVGYWTPLLYGEKPKYFISVAYYFVIVIICIFRLLLLYYISFMVLNCSLQL